MKMRGILMAVVASVITTCVMAQDVVTPMFKALPQRTEYNAALRPDCRVAVQLPLVSGLKFGFQNSGFSFNDVFTRGTEDDSLYLDLNKLYEQMPSINYTNVDIDLPLFMFGIDAKRAGYFSLSVYDRTRVDMTFNKKLLNFRYGIWDYDNMTTVEAEVSDIYLHTLNYLEASFGYNRKFFDDKLGIGFRFKYLAGVASLLNDDLVLMLNTYEENDVYSLRLESSGCFKTSLPLDVTYNEDGYVDGLSAGDLSFSNLNPLNNKGYAFDFGITYQITPNLNIGISVVDLGQIKWRNECSEFSFGSGMNFTGININEAFKEYDISYDMDLEKSVTDYVVELKDSLMSFANITHSLGTYTTKLSPKYLAMVEYNTPYKWLGVGGVLSMKRVNGHFYSHGGISMSLSAGRWLTFIGSVNMNTGRRISPGAGLRLNAGGFQFYLVGDRVPGKIAKSTGASISTGINLTFGRPGGRKDRKVVVRHSEEDEEDEDDDVNFVYTYNRQPTVVNFVSDNGDKDDEDEESEDAPTEKSSKSVPDSSEPTGTPTETTPTEEAPTSETPAETTPTESKPAEEAPTSDMLTETTPSSDAPTESAPVETSDTESNS